MTNTKTHLQYQGGKRRTELQLSSDSTGKALVSRTRTRRKHEQMKYCDLLVVGLLYSTQSSWVTLVVSAIKFSLVEQMD